MSNTIVSDLVSVERRGPVLLIGVNRPEKRNAWNVEIIRAVATAYTQLADDQDLRAGVVFGHGADFTAGLDLMDVIPVMGEGRFDDILPPELCDPWDYMGRPCPKPIVVAVQGRCYGLGTELMLASQATVAASDAEFSQAEVTRGIVPMGGAAHRLVTRLGSRGTELLLTGRSFDATYAKELGLVNKVVEPGRQFEEAVAIAETIATNAPLAVQGSLAMARAAERAQRDAASAEMMTLTGLLTSEDALEGMTSMMERRPPVFAGR